MKLSTSPLRKSRKFLLAITSSLLCIAGCSDAPATRNDLIVQLERGVPHRPAAAQNGEYRLRLFHLHTHESVDVAYRVGDRPVPGGIRMLNHLLRDWRTNQDADYPIKEFDLLHTLMQKLHRRGVIEIVCGYRSSQTNRLLRAGTPASGVAENSEHTLSQAIDIRVPGVSTERLRDAALLLKMGGVGYYPRSGFVHVDVGPIRQWSFGTSIRVHHQRRRHTRSSRRVS